MVFGKLAIAPAPATATEPAAPAGAPEPKPSRWLFDPIFHVHQGSGLTLGNVAERLKRCRRKVDITSLAVVSVVPTTDEEDKAALRRIFETVWDRHTKVTWIRFGPLPAGLGELVSEGVAKTIARLGVLAVDLCDVVITPSLTRSIETSKTLVSVLISDSRWTVEPVPAIKGLVEGASSLESMLTNVFIQSRGGGSLTVNLRGVTPGAKLSEGCYLDLTRGELALTPELAAVLANVRGVTLSYAAEKPGLPPLEFLVLCLWPKSRLSAMTLTPENTAELSPGILFKAGELKITPSAAATTTTTASRAGSLTPALIKTILACPVVKAVEASGVAGTTDEIVIAVLEGRSLAAPASSATISLTTAHTPSGKIVLDRTAGLSVNWPAKLGDKISRDHQEALVAACSSLKSIRYADVPMPASAAELVELEETIFRKCGGLPKGCAVSLKFFGGASLSVGRVTGHPPSFTRTMPALSLIRAPFTAAEAKRVVSWAAAQKANVDFQGVVFEEPVDKAVLGIISEVIACQHQGQFSLTGAAGEGANVSLGAVAPGPVKQAAGAGAGRQLSATLFTSDPTGNVRVDGDTLMRFLLLPGLSTISLQRIFFDIDLALQLVMDSPCSSISLQCNGGGSEADTVDVDKRYQVIVGGSQTARTVNINAFSDETSLVLSPERLEWIVKNAPMMTSYVNFVVVFDSDDPVRTRTIAAAVAAAQHLQTIDLTCTYGDEVIEQITAGKSKSTEKCDLTWLCEKSLDRSISLGGADLAHLLHHPQVASLQLQGINFEATSPGALLRACAEMDAKRAVRAITFSEVLPDEASALTMTVNFTEGKLTLSGSALLSDFEGALSSLRFLREVNAAKVEWRVPHQNNGNVDRTAAGRAAREAVAELAKSTCITTLALSGVGTGLEVLRSSLSVRNLTLSNVSDSLMEADLEGTEAAIAGNPALASLALEGDLDSRASTHILRGLAHEPPALRKVSGISVFCGGSQQNCAAALEALERAIRSNRTLRDLALINAQSRVFALPATFPHTGVIGEALEANWSLVKLAWTNISGHLLQVSTASRARAFGNQNFRLEDISARNAKIRLSMRSVVAGLGGSEGASASTSELVEFSEVARLLSPRISRVLVDPRVRLSSMVSGKKRLPFTAELRSSAYPILADLLASPASTVEEISFEVGLNLQAVAGAIFSRGLAFAKVKVVSFPEDHGIDPAHFVRVVEACPALERLTIFPSNNYNQTNVIALLAGLSQKRRLKYVKALPLNQRAVFAGPGAVLLKESCVRELLVYASGELSKKDLIGFIEVMQGNIFLTSIGRYSPRFDHVKENFSGITKRNRTVGGAVRALVAAGAARDRLEGDNGDQDGLRELHTRIRRALASTFPVFDPTKYIENRGGGRGFGGYGRWY